MVVFGVICTIYTKKMPNAVVDAIATIRSMFNCKLVFSNLSKRDMHMSVSQTTIELQNRRRGNELECMEKRRRGV